MDSRLLLLTLPVFLLGCPTKDSGGGTTTGSSLTDGGSSSGTDSGATDGGTMTGSDGGTNDGGSTDAGQTDGGSDAGSSDGGADAGSSDAGSSDGGTSSSVDLTPDPKSQIAHMQQYDGYAENDAVTVTGVATSPDTGSGFFMADAAGPWAGIWVYSGGTATVNQGDTVTVTAALTEYNDITELNASAGKITVGTGGTIPDPTLLATADLANAEVAEAFESVFVQVADVTVTNDNADGPDADYGEFLIDDVLRVDDLFYDAAPTTGDTYSMLQGVLNYTYSQYKIEPRDDGDVRVR